jgi:hypothetical protein
MERPLRLAWPLRLAALVMLTAGCLPSISDLDTGPLNSTFAVSDFFAPSGYMGDGKFFGRLSGTPNVGCKPNGSLHRGSCYAFTYYPNNVDEDPWAGVFWVFPSNSWGATSGHAIDVAKFKQISFWAAVDGPKPYLDDDQMVPFSGQAGGIDPKGRYAHDGGKDYVDGVNTGTSSWLVGDPAGVTSEMKQFHIPLTDFQKAAGCQDPFPDPKMPTVPNPSKAINCQPSAAARQMGLSAEQAHAMLLDEATYLIGAFAWAVHYPRNAVAGCVPAVDPNTNMPIADCRKGVHTSLYVNPPPVHIYLDDIVWDTQDPPAP